MTGVQIIAIWDIVLKLCVYVIRQINLPIQKKLSFFSCESAIFKCTIIPTVIKRYTKYIRLLIHMPNNHSLVLSFNVRLTSS